MTKQELFGDSNRFRFSCTMIPWKLCWELQLECKYPGCLSAVLVSSLAEVAHAFQVVHWSHGTVPDPLGTRRQCKPRGNINIFTDLTSLLALKKMVIYYTLYICIFKLKNSIYRQTVIPEMLFVEEKELILKCNEYLVKLMWHIIGFYHCCNLNEGQWEGVTAASTKSKQQQQQKNSASRVKYPCPLWDKRCEERDGEWCANGQVQGKTGLGEKRRARLKIATVIPHRLSPLLKADRAEIPWPQLSGQGSTHRIVLHVCGYCWGCGCTFME